MRPNRIVLLAAALMLSVPSLGRSISFVQTINYCDPIKDYLQGQITIKNISSIPQTVTTDSVLHYSTGPNVYVDETRHSVSTIQPGALLLHHHPSNQAGYGCHGIASFHGTVQVKEDKGAVIANGFILTQAPNLTTGTPQSTYLTFPINAARPF